MILLILTQSPEAIKMYKNNNICVTQKMSEVEMFATQFTKN